LFSPEISPGLADDLKGLPDAYIIVGETDVLKDENLIYAERLKRAGFSIILLDFFIFFN
jgi:acetyl esterase/lipase